MDAASLSYVLQKKPATEPSCMPYYSWPDHELRAAVLQATAAAAAIAAVAAQGIYNLLCHAS